jgi:ABC-type multidrug transport system fused ATPase/permease subunit
LLERFYEVTDLFILDNCVTIKEFNLLWFHGQISLFLQEPTLFQKSIKENVLYEVSMAITENEV